MPRESPSQNSRHACMQASNGLYNRIPLLAPRLQDDSELTMHHARFIHLSAFSILSIVA